MPGREGQDAEGQQEGGSWCSETQICKEEHKYNTNSAFPICMPEWHEMPHVGAVLVA